jgi:hypothetical protein
MVLLDEMLELELQHKKGVAGVPLFYVIWEALPHGHVFVMSLSNQTGWSGMEE